jgi:hypothetical protein
VGQPINVYMCLANGCDSLRASARVWPINVFMFLAAGCDSSCASVREEDSSLGYWLDSN